MPRPLRIDPPGSWHHVMNRGARHQAIFADDQDRASFLDLLGAVTTRNGVEVHAYALMADHFHLLVCSRRGRLSEAMRHLQQRWTQTVNRRHGWDGPLFRSRFRSQLVADDRTLHTLVAYLHLNPVRAGLVEHPAGDPWTSHRAYLGKVEPPAWLHVDELRDAIGGPEAVAELVEDVEDLPEDLRDPPTERLPAGPLTGDTLRAPPDALPPRGTDEVMSRILHVTGVSIDALYERQLGPQANPARRFAVWALRQSTDLSQSEVGEVLKMSTRQVQNVEYRLSSSMTPPVAGWVATWLSGEDGA